MEMAPSGSVPWEVHLVKEGLRSRLGQLDQGLIDAAVTQERTCDPVGLVEVDASTSCAQADNVLDYMYQLLAESRSAQLAQNVGRGDRFGQAGVRRDRVAAAGSLSPSGDLVDAPVPVRENKRNVRQVSRNFRRQS